MIGGVLGVVIIAIGALFVLASAAGYREVQRKETPVGYPVVCDVIGITLIIAGVVLLP